MKKILLLVAVLFAGVFSAGAWSHNMDKGVLLFASKHLTPEAKNIVAEYIGDDITKVEGYLAAQRKGGKLLHTESWHTLHLDSNLQPSAKDENDALVQIEKALEVIRNRTQHDKAEVSFALKTVMNLMLDMHNLSNVSLADYPLSGTDFEFMMSKGSARGKGGKLVPYRWKVLWTYRYVGFHAAYSPEMWVEELGVMFGTKRAELSAGTLRDWVADIGSYSKPVYERLYKDNNHFLHATIHSYDLFHMSCVAKASYRLAALLNENLK